VTEVEIADASTLALPLIRDLHGRPTRWPAPPTRARKRAKGDNRAAIFYNRQSRGKTSTQNLCEDKNMEETGPVEQVKR
jgi:hypothetical protein